MNNPLAFLGDVNFQTVPKVEDKLAKYLSDKVVVANFEGYLSETTDPSTLGITMENFLHMVKVLNIKYLNIANNHVFDGGLECFKHTIKALHNLEIEFFGLKEKPFIIVEIGGLKFGILSFAWRMTGTKNKALNICILRLSKIKKQIKELKKTVDYIIIYPHWGIDMETLPHPWQILAAQQLLKLGADLIIGHHPHMIQPFQGKVFYSIGNTYLPENEVTRYQKKTANAGLIVVPKINGKNIEIEFKGIKFSNEQIYLDDNPNVKLLEYSGDYVKFFKRYRAKKMIPIFTGKVQDYFFALPYLLLLEKIVHLKPIMKLLRKRRKRNK